MTVGRQIYTFTYDAMGRRLSKVGNGTTENYYYDGGKIAYVTNSAGTVTQRFTYDQSGRLLYMGMNGTMYYYHYNAHSDVVALTDLTGTTVDGSQYQYDAYENIAIEPTPGSVAAANPYRYAGYWYDKETKLYYLHARYYRPEIGRFISQDTHKGNPWQPSTQNLYTYVGNNPVNYTDPTGHIALPWTESLRKFEYGALALFSLGAFFVASRTVALLRGGTTVHQAKTQDKNQDTTHETPEEALDHAKEKAGDLGNDAIKTLDQDGNVIGEKSADGKRLWRIDDGHVNSKVIEDGNTTGGHDYWNNGESVPNGRNATQQWEVDSHGNWGEVGQPVGGRGR